MPAEPTLADSFGKAKLAVGVVELVEELPNSNKLYRCQVQIGGGEKRQVNVTLSLKVHRSR